MMRPFNFVCLSFAAAVAQASSAGAAGPAYVLGPDDQVTVVVLGQPELSVKTRVKSGGTITLPVIGPVKAAGESVQSLADSIETKLRSGGVVRQPVVNVEIEAFVSRSATVLGAVGQPGIYPLERLQTVSSVIARAGGVRAEGSERVTLRRGRDGSVVELDLALLAREAARDLTLDPGDVVYVPPHEQFYVYGQVNAPGGYPLPSGMTLRQALARGGGPTLAGTERRVILYREGAAPVDADLDMKARKGDVLFVRERLF